MGVLGRLKRLLWPKLQPRNPEHASAMPGQGKAAGEDFLGRFR
jgi:hypothetical protein